MIVNSLPYFRKSGMKCPKCKKDTVRVKVDLFLDIPIRFHHHLTKKNLRSKEVKVDGANWPKSTMYCENGDCGWMFDSAAEQTFGSEVEAAIKYHLGEATSIKKELQVRRETLKVLADAVLEENWEGADELLKTLALEAQSPYPQFLRPVLSGLADSLRADEQQGVRMSPAADPNPYGVKVVPIEHAERSRSERILCTVEDMIADFLYYDRKEDEDLPRGEVEAAIEAGEVTVEQIVERFAEKLREGLD